jgi:replicative DNA helicase
VSLVEPAANYVRAADLFTDWQSDVTGGQPPSRWPVGKEDLATVELGPGRVLLIGGAPGAGKTAFVMQAVFDALRLTGDLRAVVCNVEMTPHALLERQLARLSRVPLTDIRGRTLTADAKKKLRFADVKALAGRLSFVQPPYSLENVAHTADTERSGLIVLDYIQRISPPGAHGERRLAVESSMSYVRQFAERGCGVIVVAAVGRSKDTKGRNSYAGENLTLGSFRESSELEYGADDAYILCPGATPTDPHTLRHLKSRYGETRDIPLAFTKPIQEFKPFAMSPPENKK